MVPSSAPAGRAPGRRPATSAIIIGVVVSLLISAFLILVPGPAPAGAQGEGATIYVTKVLWGGDDTDTYDFTFNPPDPGVDVPFQLNQNETRTFAGLPAGEYTITESTDAFLDDVFCDVAFEDFSKVIDEQTQTVQTTITVGEDAEVHCVFMNLAEGEEPPSQISVAQLVENNPADTTEFDYTVLFEPEEEQQFQAAAVLPADMVTPFTLTHLQTEEFVGDEEIGEGTYTLNRLPEPGYERVSTSCFANTAGASQSLITLNGMDSAELNIDGNAHIHCLFVDRVLTGTLEVVKVVDPDGDPGLFDLLIDGVVEADNVGDGTTGPVTVSAGTHTVAETLADGSPVAGYSTTLECFTLSEGLPFEPVAVSAAGEVDVPAIEEVRCTFTNTRLVDNNLTVSVVGGDPTFALDPAEVAPFVLDPGESASFDDLPPGVYTLTMTALEDGFVLDAITCGADQVAVNLALRTVTFDVAPVDDIDCLFTVSEIDEPDPYDTYDDDPGDPDFDFDTPFEDANDPATPGPTVGGVTVADTTSTPGAGDPPVTIAGEPTAQPAPAGDVAPAALDQLPRTGVAVRNLTFLAGLLLITGSLASLLSPRRRRIAQL